MQNLQVILWAGFKFVKMGIGGQFVATFGKWFFSNGHKKLLKYTRCRFSPNSNVQNIGLILIIYG